MTQEKTRFLIHTLGCKVNQYDSERMRSQLVRKGYESIGSSDKEKADLIIVNTCSVTAESDRKGRQAIRKLIRNHPSARVMVTGCYAERFPDRVGGIDGVDAVVPIQDQEKWVEEMTASLGWGCDDQDALWDHANRIETFFERTRAFIKIQDGCDLKCTYCSIPLSRGKARSRRIAEVLDETRLLVKKGFPEIVICGICLGNFGLDTGETLAALIRKMAGLDGLRRIRISSFEPQNLTDDFFAAMAENAPIVCPHLHLPLQSGSNAILRRMKRPYSYEYFLERVEKAKERIPHFEVTTDVMVGFPGETEDDYNQSLQAIRECRFTKVHSFRFSVREDTPAAKLPNRVSPQESEERRKHLDQLASTVADQAKTTYIGTTLPVLVETNENNRWVGFTPNYIRAELESATPLQQGDVVDVIFTSLGHGILSGAVK
jgi:threonylcarbamoyladenosine tRNA methylthiotransferase MtaB